MFYRELKYVCSSVGSLSSCVVFKSLQRFICCHFLEARVSCFVVNYLCILLLKTPNHCWIQCGRLAGCWWIIILKRERDLPISVMWSRPAMSAAAVHNIPAALLLLLLLLLGSQWTWWTDPGDSGLQAGSLDVNGGRQERQREQEREREDVCADGAAVRAASDPLHHRGWK